MERVDSLDEKLRRIRQEEPIALDAVDWTIHNPEALHDALGRTFKNFQRVEQEVDDTTLETLLPNLSEQKLSFIQVWKEQENPHGDLFGELRRRLGDEPEDFRITEVPRMNRLAGALGRVSVGVHEVFEMIYLTRGAMHERLTKQGYDLMAERLSQLGEHALRETMIKPILRQEAHHLGYYLAAAKQLKSHLRPWQVHAARRLSVATYAPVGAGAKKFKPDFGHTALALTAGPPTASELETLGSEADLDELAELRLRKFSEPIQKIGRQLLVLGKEEVLPDFVYKGIVDCVEAERETGLAA